MEFFLDGGAVLVPATVPSLRRVRELLEEYADLPMDYADATLVVLAEEIGTGRILSTDRRDFGAYRWKNRRPFHNISLCISDHHDATSPWRRTADFVYVRGHGPGGRYRGHYRGATLAAGRRRPAYPRCS